MEALTSYQLKANEVLSELANHGWGTMVVKVESQKDTHVKIVIESGKSFVFFIRKDYLGDKSII